MVERQIVWTKIAEEELKLNLDFYNNRNQSVEYSQKILSLIEFKTNQLCDFPFLGKPAEDGICRLLVIKHFIIVYEVMEAHIVIHSLWDGRQNPNKRYDKRDLL